MTVSGYLENLASNAILSDDEKSSIETSISTLQKRLNNYFGYELKEHFKFGSSTRGTILPRNMDSESDIDYMVVFDDDSYKPQTYLDNFMQKITIWNDFIIFNRNKINFFPVNKSVRCKKL